MKLGEYPLNVMVKYEYRITSVTLHATSMLEYIALFARDGKGLTIPQMRRMRDATCIPVVLIGARTSPREQENSCVSFMISPGFV